MTNLRVPLSELVSYHVKQKLTRVLSVFHATPVSVPITDSLSDLLKRALKCRFYATGPRCSSHFRVKIPFFFQLVSTMKVKIVDKMMPSTYLCVILYVKRQKMTISCGFNLISNSW